MANKTYLTPHFTLEEMTASPTARANGIDNTPTAKQIEALTLLCIKTLEPLRVAIGKPIRVNSGYRCRALNKRVGGARTSQHQKGEAADIEVKGMTAQQLFDFILKSGICFDQVIQEFDSWVHISFSATQERRQAFMARAKNGRTVYEPVKINKLSDHIGILADAPGTHENDLEMLKQ